MVLEATSKRAWRIVLFGSLGLHVALLLVFGGKAKMVPKDSTDSLVLEIPHPKDTKTIRGLAGLSRDSGLLAQTGNQSFSGQAWLDTTPLAYTFKDWEDQTRWLGPEAWRLQTSVGITVGTSNRNESRLNPDRPVFLGQGATNSVDLVRRQTVWHLETEIKSAKLLGSPVFPIPPKGELLSPTAIGFTLGDQGKVFTARVEMASGSKSTDQLALEAVRRCEFELPKASTQSLNGLRGRIVVEWGTTSLN